MKHTRILAAVLAVVMVLGLAAVAAGEAKTVAVNPMTMTINGEAVTPLKSDGTPAEVFAYEGATYVPLRYLSELLGIEVDWDPENAGVAALVSPLTPGTYTASAPGRNGDITVTVTVTADGIAAIDTDSVETPTIGVTAMEDMAAAVVSGQTLGVDSVSGATMSCEGWMAALEDCVKQAGGNVALWKAVPAGSGAQVDYDTQADVIIVGAGGAGLTAALTASGKGAKVILLEKTASVGGNSLCAANGINAYDTDVQLANEQYQAADTSVDHFVSLLKNDLNRENLIRAYIENSTEALNYVAGLGVEFVPSIRQDNRDTTKNYYLMNATAGGNTTMVNVVNALADALEQSDVTLYKNVTAQSLVQDASGAVTGVKAVDASGKELTFSGKSVVLCTGGFGKNQALLAQVNPELANAITDERAPTTGEGLMMAQAIGAKAVDLDQIQTFPHVVEDYGMIMPMGIPGDSIYVNNSGKRFVAESFEIPQALLAQDKGEIYRVFGESLASGNNNIKKLMAAGDFVVSAGSPAELAGKLGMDPDALTATLEKWNADCAAGADTLFGRENNLTALEGTLYAYKFGVGAHYFMGGLLIDETTRVLNESEQPIAGLYAAGEVTGGFHGSQRVDGSGTGDAIVFGRIAGNAAADAAK